MVELNKMAGEPVDIVVNDKLIAREVVMDELASVADIVLPKRYCCRVKCQNQFIA